MNKELINLLNETMEEYYACMDTYRDSEKSMDEIREAYRSRIAAERAYVEDRAKHLREVLTDVSKSTTARRAAQMELDKLHGTVLDPTADERTAFAAVVADAKTALADGEEAYKTLRGCFSAVEKAIAADKAETIANRNIDPLWWNRELKKLDGVELTA